jgi:glycyl-tRNA synthetase
LILRIPLNVLQFLKLSPNIAPIKCSILPLSSDKQFNPIIAQVREKLAASGISFKVDDSTGSIGRRYARTDEIGIPFGITVDFDSLKDKPATVTLRDAFTMDQVRLKVDELGEVISDLISEKKKWADIVFHYPKFEAKQD